MVRTPEQEATVAEYKSAAERYVSEHHDDIELFSFSRERVLDMLGLNSDVVGRFRDFLIDNNLRERLGFSSMILTDNASGCCVAFYNCVEAYLFVRLVDETQEVHDAIGA